MSEHLEDFLGSLSPEQKQELIKALTNDSTKPEPEPEPEPEKPKENLSHSRLMQEGNYTTQIQKNKTEGEVMGVPVNEMPRFNKFEDDGTEHKDQINKTPEVDLTERRREPYKDIEQTCTRCNKSIKTHPQHHREFFICDRCLKR